MGDRIKASFMEFANNEGKIGKDEDGELWCSLVVNEVGPMVLTSVWDLVDFDMLEEKMRTTTHWLQNKKEAWGKGDDFL